MFKNIGIETDDVNSVQIEIMEKRFKNYNGFIQLLENNDPEDNIRISNKLDSYYDIQAVNIDSETDKKKNNKTSHRQSHNVNFDESINESIKTQE